MPRSRHSLVAISRNPVLFSRLLEFRARQRLMLPAMPLRSRPRFASVITSLVEPERRRLNVPLGRFAAACRAHAREGSPVVKSYGACGDADRYRFICDAGYQRLAGTGERVMVGESAGHRRVIVERRASRHRRGGYWRRVPGWR